MQQSCQIVTESQHGGGFTGLAKAVQARPTQGCRWGRDGAHPRSHGSGQGEITPVPMAAAAGMEPPLLPWRRRAGTQPACSCHGRRGQESPAYPTGRGDGSTGPPRLSLGLWQRREGGTSPAACAACREPAPPWHNRVTICNNHEMPAFTGRLLDSAPRFPLQGLEMSENYSHISRP